MLNCKKSNWIDADHTYPEVGKEVFILVESDIIEPDETDQEDWPYVWKAQLERTQSGNPYFIWRLLLTPTEGSEHDDILHQDMTVIKWRYV